MVYPAISLFMTVACCFAIGENIFLMPIILFRSGKEIGSYKYLLFIYCLTAVVYTAIGLTLVPVLEPGPKGWLFYATEQRVSHTVGSFMIATFANCYIMLMLILEFSFIYRLCVMVAKEKLKWFNQFPYFFTPIFIYITILGICAIPIYLYMCQNAEIAVVFVLDKINPPMLDLRQVSYVGAPMFTAVPCIFTFSPPLLSYAFAFLRIYAPLISQAFAAFLPVAHVIDPLMILFVVTDYRRYVNYLLKRFCACRFAEVRDRSSTIHHSSDMRV